MESEKVKEIKKALDCCNIDKDCTDCPYSKIGNCIKVFNNDILTLINELEIENERLQEQNGALSCDLDYINEKLTNAEIEVDDYKDRIAFLEKDNELLRNAKVVYETVDYCFEDLKKAEKRIAELESENEWLVGKVKEKVNEMTTYTVNNQKLKDRIAELKKENGELNEKLTVFDPISAFADNYAKGVRQAEENVLNMFMKLVDRYRNKLDEQKHFYETASISHRDISLTALNTAYRCLDETLKEFINKGDDK